MSPTFPEPADGRRDDGGEGPCGLNGRTIPHPAPHCERDRPKGRAQAFRSGPGGDDGGVAGGAYHRSFGTTFTSGGSAT